MKKVTTLGQLLLAVVLFVSINTNAQVTIGSITAPADYSLLELDNSIKKGGLRLPQLSGQDIVDFKNLAATYSGSANPVVREHVEGLEFFNLDTHCVEFWNGGSWQSLCGNDASNYILERLVILRDSIIILNERIEIIEDFTQLSGVTDYMCQDRFSGLGVSAIHNGFSYNFWGTGTFTSGTSLNGTYWLLRSGANDNQAGGICKALSWYQGEPTTGTVWLHNTSGGTPYLALPAKFSNQGIEIITSNNIGVGAGSSIMFTQSLILVDPATIKP